MYPAVDNPVDVGQSSTIDEEPCTPTVDNSVDDERSWTIIQERCSPPVGGNIFDAGELSNGKKCRRNSEGDVWSSRMVAVIRNAVLVGQWDAWEGLRLEDTSPVVFAIYAGWIYRSHPDLRQPALYKTNSVGRLVGLDTKLVSKAERATDMKTNRREYLVYANLLVRLWDHGRIHKDAAFQSLVFDELVRWNLDDGSTSRRAFEGILEAVRFTKQTEPACPLHQLCIDLADRIPNSHQWLELGANWPTWLLHGLSLLKARREHGLSIGGR